MGTCTVTTPPITVLPPNSLVTPPASSNLVVSKTGPASIAVGVPFNFTIMLGNSGGLAAAQPITLTDTVVAGLTINSVTASNGFVCLVADQDITCTRTDDVPASTATFNAFVLNATAAATLTGTRVANTISVTGGGCPAMGGCTSASLSALVLQVGQEPTQVPTLSESAWFCLTILMALSGLGFHQRAVRCERPCGPRGKLDGVHKLTRRTRSLSAIAARKA